MRPHRRPSLDGQVALVTGGASGLGAAFAIALAEDGADIVVADLAPATRVRQAIEALGRRVVAISTDVSSPASVEALAHRVSAEFGRLDVLVNNAGMFSSLTLRPFEEITTDEWDRVMGVNVRGPFLVSRAFVPIMAGSGGGRIINIASGTVFKGTPGFLHYVTSKGAVVAFTRALAREVADRNITVNALAPGLTLSDGVTANAEMLSKLEAPVLASRAIKRHSTPDDLIGALRYFASEASAFVTGQVLVVDGGSVMR